MFEDCSLLPTVYKGFTSNAVAACLSDVYFYFCAGISCLFSSVLRLLLFGLQPSFQQPRVLQCAALAINIDFRFQCECACT